MERDMNQSALPAYCRSGCGFYGSPATDGLCSKCFKDSLKRKQDPGRLSPASSSSSVPKSDSSMSSHESLTSPTTSNSCLTGAPIMMNSIEAVDVPGMIQNALNEKIAAAALIEEAKKSAAEDAANAADDSSSSSSSGSSSTSEKKDDAASSEDNSPQPPPEKKSNRCDECRKKVGFTGFECRCGGLYCAIHRYSDMHFCPFDYKALGAEEIRKNNPVVKNEKIQKL